MFDRETFDRIQEVAAPTLNEVGGVTYSDKGLVAVEPPMPKPLAVATLTSLVGFIMSRPAGYMDGKIIHVSEPHVASIVAPHGTETNSTYEYLHASAERAGLRGITEDWSDLEEFIIKMNTLFDVTKGDHLAVRSTLSVVTADSTLILTDDGTSQNIAMKSGIQRKESGELPNPVMLAPFCTFPEIEQPQLPFILRLKRRGEGLQARLFPVESPGWKAVCCSEVRCWLNKEFAAHEGLGTVHII